MPRCPGSAATLDAIAGKNSLFFIIIIAYMSPYLTSSFSSPINLLFSSKFSPRSLSSSSQTLMTGEVRKFSPYARSCLSSSSSFLPDRTYSSKFTSKNYAQDYESSSNRCSAARKSFLAFLAVSECTHFQFCGAAMPESVKI